MHGAQSFHIGYNPQAAALAVDFFFLLSGFVLANAYDERLDRRWVTWRKFMKLRFIRLYPMLLFGTTVGGLLALLNLCDKQGFNGLAVLMLLLVTALSFALIPIGLVVGTDAYPLNNVAWSLFFEFVVSALYGGYFGRLKKGTLATFVAASGIALIAMAVFGGPYYDIGFKNPLAFLLGFVRVAYPFWAGVLLFRIDRLQKLSSVPIGVIGMVLVLLLAPQDCSASYSLLLVLFVFPVLLTLAASARLSDSTARVCCVLGRLSYPLYLIHFPLLNMLPWERRLGLSPWGLLVVFAVASIVTAEVLLIVFDEPVRTWLAKTIPSGEVDPSVRTTQPGLLTGSATSGGCADPHNSFRERLGANAMPRWPRRSAT
jgi:peptidoglycan/LPS O-acetylase OafA/YrhL